MYDFDEFFDNIYLVNSSQSNSEWNLYLEKGRIQYCEDRVKKLLKGFILGKIEEAEEQVKRIEESQKKEWKDKVELWNKKFQQMGIKIKNNVVKESDDKTKADFIRDNMPATFIGAYDVDDKAEKRICRACSGPIPKGDIGKLSMDFKRCVNKVGKIGEIGIAPKNRIGRCAEFHAVYEMLRLGANFYKIRLTRPFRVKYKMKKIGSVPYCDNCKKMFEGTKILDKEEGEEIL